MSIKKGEIYMVDLGEGVGSEIGGIRPAVIIQNDIGNKYSPITYVAPITSNIQKTNLIGNIFISKEESSLPVDSTIDINQIRAVDKSRLDKCVGKVPDNIIHRFSSFMQFIVDGDNTVMENNTKIATKYISDDTCIEMETNQILKEFYSNYKKDNSFPSKFIDSMLSSIIGHFIFPIITFLLGLFLSKK